MSESVFELLRKRYPAPAWAFLEEVRNGTGYGRVTRTADALAMSLYPSRGLHLHGFEVKISRSDWLAELRNPEKAEEIAKHCHFWCLVIDRPEIVQNGEVPMTWGLLVSDGKKLTVEREPTFNKEALPPTYKFLGAILRKVCSTATDQSRLDQARAEGHDAGWKDGVAHAEKHDPTDAYKLPYDQLVAKVRAFEEAAGVSIDDYAFGRITATVKLLHGGWESPVDGIESLAKTARNIAERADEAVAEAKSRLVPAAAKTAST